MIASVLVRSLRFVPAIMWAVGIFTLSHQPRLPHLPVNFDGIDKVVHAVVYAVGAACFLYGARWPTGPAAWWCAASVALFGVTDEWHQGYVPGRNADVLDWVADCAGAFLLAAVWLRWASRRARAARLSIAR